MKKFILILGQNGDFSTDRIIEWIKFYSNKEVIRINDTDYVTIASYAISKRQPEFKLQINGNKVINSAEIHSYFYRRGGLNMITAKSLENQGKHKDIISGVTNFYRLEMEHLAQAIHSVLGIGAIRINGFEDISINKLVVCTHAQQAGLNTPATLISNDKDTIRNFVKSKEAVVTKPIRLPGHYVNYESGRIHFSQKTELITLQQLDNFFEANKYFVPTLFQEYISK